VVNTIVPRQRTLLQSIWRSGRLSRRDLHEQTGIRPNTVGSDAALLLKEGILRECTTKSLGRGRPRVPLEIDPARRHVIGIAIRPGHVEVGRLNLLGHLLDKPAARTTNSASTIISSTVELLEERIDDATLGIGLSTPGFVDPVKRAILFSAMTSRTGAVSLKPAFDAAGKLPVVLENDMHALAARWLLTHQQEQDEDVLLVYFEDGQLGSAILIEGRPNRGCVTGANELGHTRLPVETDVCFCGHPGCLERICSTPFLHRQGPARGTLGERAATFVASDEPMKTMIDHLATGFANAMNFTRANRLVLVSELTRHQAFTKRLTAAIRERVLGEILERMRIDVWDQPAARSAETAGWLALASLYYEGWDHVAVEGATEKNGRKKAATAAVTPAE
jgi:predicted NBD/HSP70 family sugar kinase